MMGTGALKLGKFGKIAVIRWFRLKHESRMLLIIRIVNNIR